MQVHFTQIYIEPGVSFPFSHHFQNRISEEVTSLVTPSADFLEKFGSDLNLVLNISAKKALRDNEVKGPTVFKKTKDVEYTIFLPFDLITRSQKAPECALRFMLKGACSILESLGIDTAEIVATQESLIAQICSEPLMFKNAFWRKEKGSG